MDFPKKHTTLFGKLLTKVRFETRMAKEKAVREMISKHNINPKDMDTKYKIEESASVFREGTEVTTYKLWQLIDKTVVTVSSEVKMEINTGIQTEEDPDELRRQQEANTTQSPI